MTRLSSWERERDTARNFISQPLCYDALLHQHPTMRLDLMPTCHSERSEESSSITGAADQSPVRSGRLIHNSVQKNNATPPACPPIHGAQDYCEYTESFAATCRGLGSIADGILLARLDTYSGSYSFCESIRIDAAAIPYPCFSLRQSLVLPCILSMLAYTY